MDILKIDTDEGISGWGELISGTKTETVVAGAYEMGEYLIDKDPRQIEDMWQVIYRSFLEAVL